MAIVKYLTMEVKRLHQMLSVGDPFDDNNVNIMGRYANVLTVLHDYGAIINTSTGSYDLLEAAKQETNPHLTVAVTELLITNHKNPPLTHPALVNLDYLIMYIGVLPKVDSFRLLYSRHGITCVDGFRVPSSTVLQLTIKDESIQIDSTVPPLTVFNWIEKRGRAGGFIAEYLAEWLERTETLRREFTLDTSKLLAQTETACGILRAGKRLAQLKESCANSLLLRTIDQGRYPNVSKAFIEALVRGYAKANTNMDDLFDPKYDWVLPLFDKLESAETVTAEVAYVEDPSHFRINATINPECSFGITLDLPKELIKPTLERFSV